MRLQHMISRPLRPAPSPISMAVVAVAAALLAFAPSAGAASGWTTAQSFGGTDVELTRAGIAADGTSAVAWRRTDARS